MELPKTYQGMKDYIRYAEKEIKNCTNKIERLMTDISIMKAKIKKIDDQETVPQIG